MHRKWAKHVDWRMVIAYFLFTYNTFLIFELVKSLFSCYETKTLQQNPETYILLKYTSLKRTL